MHCLHSSTSRVDVATGGKRSSPRSLSPFNARVDESLPHRGRRHLNLSTSKLIFAASSTYALTFGADEGNIHVDVDVARVTSTSLPCCIHLTGWVEHILKRTNPCRTPRVQPQVPNWCWMSASHEKHW
ncbi:hypothetical protein Rhow_006040 [Rhodococcus wratislaviensis]|uniref:Uncharacterized protein n=1 Tax=Rhodococcus wratislaviensis TaxID=44752 RepID=A0A402CEQ3_RHOWR|nr:hypothetical protein Rhow_006040 [Rhodococcus wratislaviensis]